MLSVLRTCPDVWEHMHITVRKSFVRSRTICSYIWAPRAISNDFTIAIVTVLNIGRRPEWLKQNGTNHMNNTTKMTPDHTQCIQARRLTPMKRFEKSSENSKFQCYQWCARARMFWDLRISPSDRASRDLSIHMLISAPRSISNE